jgi:LmeA-like phospholipid-binding
MNNRDDAEPTPDHEPRTQPSAEGAETPAVSDNATSDELNSDTDQFPPVAAGRSTEAYSSGRQDTAQLEVPPDGFQPYDAAPVNAGPPPDFAAGPIAPQRPKRRTGVIVGIVALSLVLVLVIAGLGSELFIRNKAQDCLEQSFGDLTGASTSVTLSKKPMLLQWASGTVPYVQVDTSNEGESAMRLHARGDDIKSGDNETTIGELQGSGYVPFARIMELSQTPQGEQTDPSDPASGGGLSSLLGAMGGGMTVDSVTGNAADGTVTVKGNFQLLMLPIPAEAVLKPVTQNGKLTFEVVQASAATLGIPNSWAQALVDQISAGLFPPLFDDLTFEQLTVSDKGVEFAVSGNDLALNEQTVGSTQSSSQETCSVI